MNVLWLMVVSCVGVVLQMLLFRRAGQRGITYRRYLNRERAQIGDRLELIEEITSRRLIPVPWLRVESQMPRSLVFSAQSDLDIEDERYHRSMFCLMPFRRIRRHYRITCVHRGLICLDSVTLTSGDLLGLYSAHQTLALNARILVYPRILDFSQLQLPSRYWQGDVIVRRWIQPDQYLINGIRDYRPGDNRRDIHAGATARTGTPQVKTHDYTASPQIVVVLNAQRDQKQWGKLLAKEQESMEAAVTHAATIIAWCRSQRVPCGFASNGYLQGGVKETVYLNPGSAPSHYDDAMEMVARIVMDRQLSFYHYMEQLITRLPTEGVDVLVVSCYWSAELEQQAQRLRSIGHHVTYYPVPIQEVSDEAIY